jgi:hypothetical protein
MSCAVAEMEWLALLGLFKVNESLGSRVRLRWARAEQSMGMAERNREWSAMGDVGVSGLDSRDVIAGVLMLSTGSVEPASEGATLGRS